MLKLLGLIVIVAALVIIAATLVMIGSAEEINIEASAGEIIASGIFCGNVFAFPSEQMNGFFWYGAYAFEDFGNSIDFYDFETSRKIEIVYGGNDDGHGRLTNKLNGKSLLPDNYDRGASGSIRKVFLDDDGTLVFQSEVGNWRRISFAKNRQLMISDANVTAVDSRYLLDQAKEELIFEYDKSIDRSGVVVRVKDGKITVRTLRNQYSIDGLEVSGIQLSKDSSKLAVFAKGTLWNTFRGLDDTRKTRLVVTEEDKEEVMRELQQELSEAQEGHEAGDMNEMIEFWSQEETIRAKLDEESLQHKLNILIVYDLNGPPFVQGSACNKDGLN